MADLTRNSAVSVGATSVLVSEAKEREELIITNTSTAGQNITLLLGEGEAVSTYGVYLAPFSTYFSSKSAGFMPFQGRISAISDAVGGALSVFERMTYGDI